MNKIKLSRKIYHLSKKELSKKLGIKGKISEIYTGKKDLFIEIKEELQDYA